jgi:plasmid stabilization system protein ParE
LPEAVLDLARVRDFIRIHNPEAAARAAKQIIAFVQKLQVHPLIGRPVIDIERPKLRDLFSPFGQAGYYVRYTVTDNEINFVRIWHSRENRIVF